MFWGVGWITKKLQNRPLYWGARFFNLYPFKKGVGKFPLITVIKELPENKKAQKYL